MYVFARFFSSASNENTPRKWRWHLLHSTSLDWLSLAIIQTTLEREICQNSDIVWLKIVSSSTLFELAVSCSHFSLFTSASLLVWNFCLINFNSITMISHTLYSDTVQNSRHPLGLMLLENSLKLSLLSVTMFTSNCRLTQFTILPSSQHSVFFSSFTTSSSSDNMKSREKESARYDSTDEQLTEQLATWHKRRTMRNWINSWVEKKKWDSLRLFFFSSMSCT